MCFCFDYHKTLTSRSNDGECTALSIENQSLLPKPELHTTLMFFNAQCNYGPMGTEKEKVTKDKNNNTPFLPHPPKKAQEPKKPFMKMIKNVTSEQEQIRTCNQTQTGIT